MLSAADAGFILLRILESCLQTFRWLVLGRRVEGVIAAAAAACLEPKVEGRGAGPSWCAPLGGDQ